MDWSGEDGGGTDTELVVVMEVAVNVVRGSVCFTVTAGV